MKAVVKISKLVCISLIILALAACARTPDDDGEATQTPVYIVVTDTPSVSDEPEATDEPVEPTSEPEPTAEPTLIPGMPAPFLCEAEVVEQTFERGIMFWVGATSDELCQTEHDFAIGSGEIWVGIFDSSGRSGDWIIVPDTWDSTTEAESDPAFVPPSDDVSQPVRGFGKVWREGLTEAQRESIGWATGQELKFVTDYRYDAGGYLDDSETYVPQPGTHRLIALNGDEFFFDEATRTVLYPAGVPLPEVIPTPTPEATPES